MRGVGIRMELYSRVHRLGEHTDHHREDMVPRQDHTARHQDPGFTDLRLEYMVHHRDSTRCNHDLDPTPLHHTHPKAPTPTEAA
jgi:hypothetical protein